MESALSARRRYVIKAILRVEAFSFLSARQASTARKRIFRKQMSYKMIVHRPKGMSGPIGFTLPGPMSPAEAESLCGRTPPQGLGRGRAAGAALRAGEDHDL